LPEVPALLESGPNYLITPRYSDTGAHIRRTLPGLRHVQLTPRTSAAMARLARALHERGSYLLDLSTQNLLTDEVDGLKVIDWEFLQDFSGHRPLIDESPTVLGRADGEPDADMPVGASFSEGRGTLFRPLYTGVPRALLLRVPARVLPFLAEPGMVVLHGARLLRRAARRSAVRVRHGGKQSLKAALTVLLVRSD
jgi:hypothetical protein